MNSLAQFVADIAPIIQQAEMVIGRDYTRPGQHVVFYLSDRVKAAKAAGHKGSAGTLFIDFDQTRINQFDRTKPVSRDNPVELEMILAIVNSIKGRTDYVADPGCDITPETVKWLSKNGKTVPNLRVTTHTPIVPVKYGKN